MTIEEAKLATKKAVDEYEKLLKTQTDFTEKLKTLKMKAIDTNKVYRDLVKASIQPENLLGANISTRGRKATNGNGNSAKPGRKKKVTEE